MPQFFDRKLTFDAGFVSTQPLDGVVQNSIYRGVNMIVKKAGSQLYAEMWGGVESTSETAGFTTLTGTWAVTSGNATITGTGTAATTELIFGQWIVIDARLYQVRSINSNTSVVVSPTPSATTSGATGIIPHTLQDVDFFRATFARGSIERLPQGHLVSAGQGVARFDGSTLTSSLTLSNQIQLSKYNSVAGTYTNYLLGMTATGNVTLAAVSGGTKNMQAGDYSIRVCPARLATGGWNNPLPKVVLSGLTANQRIEIDFSGATFDSARGQDAWTIFGSLYNASAQAAQQGPWYLLSRGQQPQSLLRINPRGTVAITSGSASVAGTDTFFLDDYAAGDTVEIDGNNYVINAIASNTSMTLTTNASTTASGVTTEIIKAVYEWLNAEIQRGTLLEFNNDPPPRASFVGSLGGVPVLVSCRGPAPIGLEGDYNPGPTIQPSKPNNVEAFPTESRSSVSPPETIIGLVDAQARLFLMTENRLHFASFVSNDAEQPIVTRPFWKSGFRNPYSLTFVNGYLYGFTNRGPTRSIADGDEGSEEFAFADRVSDTFQPWIPERVLVAYDAKNEAIVFFHNNDQVNGAGKQAVIAMMFMLRSQVWSTPILIEDSDEDVIVSGASVISGTLYLNLLKRDGGGAYTCVTYRWDSGTNSIGWYLATEYGDNGAYPSDTCITGLRVTALLTSATAGIHGPRSDQENFNTIETGNSVSASGSIALANSTAVKAYPWKKLNVKALQQVAVRVDGNYTSGSRHRVESLQVQGFVTEGGY